MILRFSLFLATAFALTACVTPQEAPTQPASADSIARGGQIAAAQCASCHAIDATSKSPHPLAPPLRALAQRFEADDLSLAMGTHSSWSDMPPLRLSREELDDLRAYIGHVRAAQP